MPDRFVREINRLALCLPLLVAGWSTSSPRHHGMGPSTLDRLDQHVGTHPPAPGTTGVHQAEAHPPLAKAVPSVSGESLSGGVALCRV